MEVVRRTRRPVVVEHRHYDATGKARYFEIHAVPVLGHDGSVTEIIEYNIDVTERRINAETLRAHERSLELLVSQLEISNRELANFASVAAHDIRSPLQTIAASAAALEVILGDQVKDDARRALTTLMRGIERLKGTITSLYRCCQVATAALDPVDIDLARLVGELCRFQLAADLERSKGRVCVAEPLHGFRGDESQILELMQNLISNALKFRRETTIPEVTVRTLALGDGWIRIEVEDNGAGIRAEDQQRIFEMFTRLEESRVADGLGLGLAVCHRVVQRHGGRIGVESTYGSGSTFWVEFPPRA